MSDKLQFVSPKTSISSSVISFTPWFLETVWKREWAGLRDCAATQSQNRER